MSSNTTGCNTPIGLSVDEFEGLLKTLKEAENNSVDQARKAMRLAFKALGQNLDEGRTLLLPPSFRKVVEQLRNLPCMPKELQTRLQIDNIGILKNGTALSVDASLFEYDVNPMQPHFLKVCTMENKKDTFTYGIGLHETQDTLLTSMHFGNGDITLAPIFASDHHAMGILFTQNDGTVEVGTIPSKAMPEHPAEIPRVSVLFDNQKSIDVFISMLKFTKVRLASSLGERLSLLRKEAGISVYKAADMSGLTTARINSLEIGKKTNMTLDEAKALSALYRLPMCIMTQFNDELECCQEACKVTPVDLESVLNFASN